MGVRLKILALTCVLLSAFAASTWLSARLISGVMEELGGIVQYHIRLASLVAEVDVRTFEYELNLRRLIDRGDLSADQLERARTRQAAIAARLPAIFREASSLLKDAVADPGSDVSDKVALARVDGALGLLGRRIDPFIAVGAGVMQALDGHRTEEARARAEGFDIFEDAFGRDLDGIRTVVSGLTRDSTEETRTQSGRIGLINNLLFVAASVIGLGLFALFGYQLHGAFHRLLDGTRQVRDGELMVELPVTSQDEIGQLTGSFNRMITELRTKDRIQDTFGKYLDPRIVASLLASHGDNAQAAERRAVTIFFSDIKGFSSLSEQLTADVMVRLLNAYFTTVTKVIRDQKGIVDKYIGDAVMAFWAPPFSAGDQHAADACLAALAQQAAIREFRRTVSDVTGLRRNVPDFKVRMGLATGDVVIGTIGSETTKSYTVIGDTVNLASRLEGVNKVYGTSILVTEDTLRLAQDAVEARELDLLVVAGKSEPIRVFELLCRTGELTPTAAELRGLFGEGLLAYRASQWDAAERSFRECLRVVPDDGPAMALLERLPLLRTRPAGDWNGVWGLQTK